MMNKKTGVGVIVQNQDGEFLLHQRDSNTSIMTNQWSLVGGEIEKDELPKKAAVREVQEETGLVVLSVTELGLIPFNEQWDSIIFLAKVNTTKQEVVLGEGKKLKFFTSKELLNLLNYLDYINPFLDFLKDYIKK